MTTTRRLRGPVAAVLAVVLVGCGGAAPPTAEDVDLAGMDAYGCGYGFWLGSPDGRIAVRVAADPDRAEAGGLPQEATLPDPAWDGAVLIGEDLYANWCDDVLSPGEPAPLVAERWPITAGSIALASSAPPVGCPLEVRASLHGLEATTPEGVVIDLGDRDVVNDAWGCLAG